MPGTICRHSFTIPGSGEFPLRGDVRHLEGATSAPPVIVCHGFKGFKDWGFFPTIGEELARAGYVAVTFNFSGSGIGEDPQRFDEVERFERATLSGDLHDLSCIVEACVSGGLPGPRPDGRLGLLGHSRGGAVALVHASEDDRIACLVTWAGVSTFARFGADAMNIWRRQGYSEVANARTGQVFRLRLDFLDDFERNRMRFDPVRAARQLGSPYLIVHGADDETVPLAEAEELQRWAPSRNTEFRLIEGAGHTFGAVHPFAGTGPELEGALRATTSFLHAHLPLEDAGARRNADP